MRDVCSEMIDTVKDFDPINIEEDMQWLYEMTNEKTQGTAEDEIKHQITWHRPDLGEEVEKTLYPGFIAGLRVPKGVDKA